MKGDYIKVTASLRQDEDEVFRFLNEFCDPYCNYRLYDRRNYLSELKNDFYYGEADTDLERLWHISKSLEAKLPMVAQCRDRQLGDVKRLSSIWTEGAGADAAVVAFGNYQERLVSEFAIYTQLADAYHRAADGIRTLLKQRFTAMVAAMPKIDSLGTRAQADTMVSLFRGEYTKVPVAEDWPKGVPRRENMAEAKAAAKEWLEGRLVPTVESATFTVRYHCENGRNHIRSVYEQLALLLESIKVRPYPDMPEKSVLFDGSPSRPDEKAQLPVKADEKENPGEKQRPEETQKPADKPSGPSAQPQQAPGNPQQAPGHPQQTTLGNPQQPTQPAGPAPAPAPSPQSPSPLSSLLQGAKPLTDGLSQIVNSATHPGGDAAHTQSPQHAANPAASVPPPPPVPASPGGPQHTIAEYDAVGNHVKLSQAQNGQVTMQVTGPDGATHNYKMRIDEHGKPVIDTAVVPPGQKKPEEDQEHDPKQKPRPKVEPEHKPGEQNQDQPSASPKDPALAPAATPAPPSSAATPPPSSAATPPPPAPQSPASQPGGPELASESAAPPMVMTPPVTPPPKQEETQDRPAKPATGPILAESDKS